MVDTRTSATTNRLCQSLISIESNTQYASRPHNLQLYNTCLTPFSVLCHALCSFVSSLSLCFFFGASPCCSCKYNTQHINQDSMQLYPVRKEKTKTKTKWTDHGDRIDATAQNTGLGHRQVGGSVVTWLWLSMMRMQSMIVTLKGTQSNHTIYM